MSKPCKRERLTPISIYEIDPDQDVRFKIDKQMVEEIVYATHLASLATYVSASFDCSSYLLVAGSVIADQDGTFAVQFSPDAANWDAEESVTYYKNDPFGFSITPKSKYFRVSFANSAIAQTLFRVAIFGAY